MRLTTISSVPVSLHYLPRCLCSTATCRAPIQWFQINPDYTTKKTYSYNKNPESLRYEQKHMSVLIWNETIMEYSFNHTVVPLPNFFCTAIATINIWTTFSLLKTFFITLVTYYPLMISLTNCCSSSLHLLSN